jgi:hypothetical protein
MGSHYYYSSYPTTSMHGGRNIMTFLRSPTILCFHGRANGWSSLFNTSSRLVGKKGQTLGLLVEKRDALSFDDVQTTFRIDKPKVVVGKH